MQSLARRLERGVVLSCSGVNVAAHAFLAETLRRLNPGRVVVLVAEDLRAQELLHQDVTTLANQQRGEGVKGVLFYPSWEILPQDTRLPHPDVISDRLQALLALTEGQKQSPAGKVGTRHPATEGTVVVTSVAALLQRTFTPQTLAEHTRVVSQGARTNPLDLVEWLEDQGYEPEAQVTQRGEIALRGGILDVYPLTSPWPVRLEFFGDEVESLRTFDPLTQVSKDTIDAVSLPPAGELGLLRRAVAGSSGSKDRTATLLEYLLPGTVFLLSEPERLADKALEYSGQAVPDDPLFVGWPQFREEALCRGMTLVGLTDFASTVPGVEDAHKTADAVNIVAEAVLGKTEHASGEVALEQSSPGPERSSVETEPANVGPIFDSLESYRPLTRKALEPHIAETQRREFFNQMHRWLRQGYELHVFCNNDGERQRFEEIWQEYGLSSDAPENGAARALRPTPHLGTLSRGFFFEEGRLVVVTDAEIFGRYRVQRPRRMKASHAQATRSALDIDFTELEEGDLVVHLQHGIGRYLGLTVLPIGAGTKPTEKTAKNGSAGQECLVLEYAPHDPAQPAPKLYVPVTEAHLVSKYVGTGKARPPLNTLGGTKWAKAKAQAERAVRDVASELLAIQAARESQAGHQFQPDAPWQREFESAFIFEETVDQLRAINETKSDMERPKPMDRLICGDVGFGKTEVGIRAGFKAALDGKQVAVLVPTTVLAQQHYNTFRERMADYPVRIELLSRFRTKREQQRVIKDLAAGAVDIVIGTHRLLQKDIVFKDLGLVIIDEEQRFGVLHKEKFKMLRHLVDVLTLSATPIPRTLYLALSGARDMSTIQTPPHDRLPVETVVTQYDERIIRDAIQRELNRGGQVFFLHNRVNTIHAMAQKLGQLVPQARMVVGHGQMHSDDLEEVMTTFINGEADILLSTTIIESGLDIPNANTIIIDRADRFGLSDLYQLRGRVGRYKHQAYAYLLLPRHARLLTDVRKRMSAIKQYSTLGSGFKIAMRDLEIRGAGNLLGSEQSGHITAVGFELYCQLLKQSVSALKGEPVKPRVEVNVRLDFLSLNPTEIPLEKKDEEGEAPPGSADALPVAKTRAAPGTPESATIPYNYISDARQRIEIYRKLAQATDKQALQELEKEVRDRFGPLPRPITLLLLVGELKVLAAERGITAIEVKDDRLMLTRNNDYIMVGSKFPRVTKPLAEGRLKEIKKLLTVL